MSCLLYTHTFSLYQNQDGKKLEITANGGTKVSFLKKDIEMVEFFFIPGSWFYLTQDTYKVCVTVRSKPIAFYFDASKFKDANSCYTEFSKLLE